MVNVQCIVEYCILAIHGRLIPQKHKTWKSARLFSISNTPRCTVLLIKIVVIEIMLPDVDLFRAWLAANNFRCHPCHGAGEWHLCTDIVPTATCAEVRNLDRVICWDQYTITDIQQQHLLINFLVQHLLFSDTSFPSCSYYNKNTLLPEKIYTFLNCPVNTSKFK